MTTPTTDALMALADRYAFHIPGSQHSDEARAALLAALQEQAREGEVEQEPIARIMFNDDGRKTDNLIDCDLPVGTLLYAAPQAAQPEPDRTGMKYYKNDKCQAESAQSPRCICWTPSEPAQPESIECDCGRIHKKTRYGWACSEPAPPSQQANNI